MNIFLGNLTSISPTKLQIDMVHNMPFDVKNGMNMTQEQLDAIGILVDSIPEPQTPTGQIVSGMFIDPTTKIITYEYATPPKMQEQQIANLQAQVLQTQSAVNSLLEV